MSPLNPRCTDQAVCIYNEERESALNEGTGSYHIFAGKDASKGLGMSSVKAEDAVPDWSTLTQDQKKVLDDWYGFFQ